MGNDEPINAKLRVLNVSKSFFKNKERFQVLDDIGYTVQSGEVLCILGPSGCGKSTLLRLIGRLDSPDSGRILIENFSHNRQPEKREHV